MAKLEHFIFPKVGGLKPTCAPPLLKVRGHKPPLPPPSPTPLIGILKHQFVHELRLILTLSTLSRTGVQIRLSTGISEVTLVWRTHERRNLLVRGKIY